MRQEMIERLNQRRWLVDEVRLVGPPQHFMSRKEAMDQRQAIMLLLNHAQDNPVHVYVHIPFCEEHCTFCMYFDQGAKEGSRRVQRYVRYIGGLLSYLRQLQGKKAIHALYVGGGTASILTINQIQELFEGMTAYLHPDAQATFEMSPRSSTPEKLETIRNLGFNRISFGLQTFSETLSRSMHRKPATEMHMKELLDCTRRLGFWETNVDLMVGVENEAADDLYMSAEKLFALRPASVSVYRESRPRLERADIQNGLEDFLHNVVEPRVSRTAELARSSEYQVPGDLSVEHVKFLDRRWTWRPVPEECRYRTRYNPYLETTLIGIGPGTFSFCGGKLFAINPIVQGQAMEDHDLSDMYHANAEELGAAILVNMLYMGSRGVEYEMFRNTVGVDVDDLFQNELQFLKEEKMIQNSGKALHRTCDHPYKWAYNEKILYPQQWIDYTRINGF